MIASIKTHSNCCIETELIVPQSRKSLPKKMDKFYIHILLSKGFFFEIPGKFLRSIVIVQQILQQNRKAVLAICSIIKLRSRHTTVRSIEIIGELGYSITKTKCMIMLINLRIQTYYLL